MVPRRLIALVAAVTLAFGLSACSPLSVFANWGGATAPTPSAAQTPDAAPTPAPSTADGSTPTPTPGCINRVISQAGTYRVDDCVNLTVAGAGITVTAAHLGTLTINGDSLQVYAQSIDVLDVNGGLNTVQTSDELGAVLLTGDRNMVTAHAAITSVVVNGNDNRVTADGGIGPNVKDNGKRNTISAQP